VGGGDRVTGYLLKYSNRLSIQDYSRTNGEIFTIDPDTIEPVRVKPMDAYAMECPDCIRILSVEEKPNYCPNCGLALDWED